jgi:hypothetical protein
VTDQRRRAIIFRLGGVVLFGRMVGPMAHETGASRLPISEKRPSVGSDPRDTRISCDCGASLSLEELFQPGRLGSCPGERPWIVDKETERCNAEKGLRLLTRSATNTYFPQVARVISLPQTVDELARRIEVVWSVLSDCKAIADIQAARRFNPEVRANLEGYSDAEILASVLSIANGGNRAEAAEVEDPRIAEFKLLASGNALIGENTSGAHAFPAARYSSKPPRPHCRDTTPIRPLPSRNPHKISSLGDACGAPTSPCSAPHFVSFDVRKLAFNPVAVEEVAPI